jgi:PQQ enzyme repeat
MRHPRVVPPVGWEHVFVCAGVPRALDARSGRVLWKVHPGAPIGGGATVAGGAVLIGYGVQFGLNERMMNPPPGSRGGIVAYAPRR